MPVLMKILYILLILIKKHGTFTNKLINVGSCHVPDQMKRVNMKKIIITGSELSSFQEKNCDSLITTGYDILVEIKAGAINPVDVKVRSMFTGDDKTLGYDASGKVIACGEAVTNFSVGDEVYYAGDISREGANASHQLVDSRITSLKPANLSFEEASAIPLTSITAYEALFERMKIIENCTSSVLIIGGAGGVGSMAIQLLKAKTECTVIATASRAHSEAWCRDLGADWIINHNEPLKPQLDKIGVGEVEYIFCANDTTFHWANIVESIAPQGVICSIVDSTEPVALNDLKRKSATFIWEFMFTRPLFKTADMNHQGALLTEVASLVESGAVRTTATESLGTLSVETVKTAHEKIVSGHTVGKMTWRVES